MSGTPERYVPDDLGTVRIHAPSGEIQTPRANLPVDAGRHLGVQPGEDAAVYRSAGGLLYVAADGQQHGDLVGRATASRGRSGPQIKLPVVAAAAVGWIGDELICLDAGPRLVEVRQA